MSLKYVKSSKDLVTSSAATRKGFLEQTLRKTKEASSFVKRAQYLCARLKDVDAVGDLIDMSDIRDELITAAGFSDKATKYFSSEELEEALRTVLATIETEASTQWRQEVVFRFLLTRGDSLGGSMRNITGADAEVKFIDALIQTLQTKGVQFQQRMSSGNRNKVQRIIWPNRVCFFNKTPKFIGKNIDVILLSGCCETNEALSTKENFLACGELKGGIDPAGADEHWKTANSALGRIRDKFLNNPPKLFFAGAAIEESMAKEIFDQLESSLLSHAANVTVHEQLFDLTAWLVGL